MKQFGSIMMKILGPFKGLFRPSRVVTAQMSFLLPDKRLSGKRIVVTGGTKGIGYAMARRFTEEGARVLITGRNEDDLAKISQEIGCHALLLDLTQVETFDAFVSQVIDVLGGVDCLVNNAGVSLHEDSYQAVSPQGFDQQFSTNLRGPFFLTQKVLSHMENNSIKGIILFISSEAGDTVDIRPYGLTKAVINSMVQGLAYLEIKNGIRVNALAPGMTATGMTGFSPEENLNYPKNPNGRVYLPQEMAEVATFLLSDVSNCISGQIITCNNGKTINARWK